MTASISSTCSTSSFVTDVLTSAGHLEKEELSTKLGAFAKKTEELKAEVYDALQKKYVEFYPNLMSAVDLSARVDLLSKEMETVANKVEKEIKAQLTVSSTEFQDLSCQLDEAKAVQSVLNRLVAVDIALQQCESAMKNRSYLEASRSLCDMKDTLSQSCGPRDSEIKILQALHKQYKTQREKLQTEMTKAWSELIRWDVKRDDGESQKAASRITVTLNISTHGQKNEASSLLQAMSDLNILDAKLDQFGERFLEYVVEPILTYKDIRIKTDTSESSWTLSVRGKQGVKSDGESIGPQVAIEQLTAVCDFISDKLFRLSVKDSVSGTSTSLMKKLGKSVHQSFIYDNIISKCLKQSIPSNSKDLDNYSKTISQTEGFQKFLVKLQMIPEDDTSLSDFVNNVNVLFANKKCQDILQEARALMRSDVHNMVHVSPESSDSLPSVGLEGSSSKRSKTSENLALASEKTLSTDTFKLPSCCISESAKSLMDLAYSTLKEATVGDGTEQCSVQLFYSVRYIFFLFCEVVPTYHKESLESLPQITALHHNNCMYLAHNLLTLGHQYRPRLPAPLCDGAATFVDLVPRLRRLGTEAFLQQMGKQRDLTLEYLAGAQGFVSVSEDASYRRSERAIKQVLHQIQRLCNVWGEVLPTNIYNKSIGTLLNSALIDIISKVTTLEDISAEDASSLHSLLSIITSKAGEFYVTQGEGSAPALLHTHVKKWAKYSELLWILNAGLQDIADRWADGKGPLAAECQPNEVKQLVRAIFQNTEKRSRALATIK